MDLTLARGPDLRAGSRGSAGDTTDAIACAIQIREGALSTQAKVLTAGGAVLFAALGATALAAERNA